MPEGEWRPIQFDPIVNDPEAEYDIEKQGREMVEAWDRVMWQRHAETEERRVREHEEERAREAARNKMLIEQAKIEYERKKEEILKDLEKTMPTEKNKMDMLME